MRRLQIHWRQDAVAARWALVVCAVAFEVFEIARACR